MLADATRMSYGYDEWATAKIFEAARALTVEQLDATGNIPHGSIRATLLHLLDVHRGYLSWWDGSLTAQEAYARTLEPADYPDLAAIRGLWQEIIAQTRAFTRSLTDEGVARYYSSEAPDGSEFGFPLWQMMAHIINHSTQHRSEIAIMLTDAGCSPGELDMIHYHVEVSQSTVR